MNRESNSWPAPEHTLTGIGRLFQMSTARGVELRLIVPDPRSSTGGRTVRKPRTTLQLMLYLARWGYTQRTGVEGAIWSGSGYRYPLEWRASLIDAIATELQALRNEFADMHGQRARGWSCEPNAHRLMAAIVDENGAEAAESIWRISGTLGLRTIAFDRALLMWRTQMRCQGIPGHPSSRWA